MTLAPSKKAEIETVLKQCLRHKFTEYNPETKYMPFSSRLLGSDRIALYSFMQSLSTHFGTSFYEPVAKLLASSYFKKAETGIKIGDQISEVAQRKIQSMMDDLVTAKRTPDKGIEIAELRPLCQQPPMRKTKPTEVDVFLEKDGGELFLFDIKTAKPNAGQFKEFKRTLLEWVAIFLAKKPEADINTLIAIPYNPYHPAPYNRWTIRGMIDLKSELLVAEEFWDFLGGPGSYQDILGCFEKVGIEMRDEIDEFFARFKSL